ncbi:hypothetical protein QYE76_048837 [Lolium multiflorum]|uniref:DUF8039 domain-containing protein n=1 Tax=Lolium multiflorum TaxID=4521 RepID=A0AAD8SNW7_LOLMU|nr:hypothetical protein QYE76_048837 [Lolium multiflorum]
MLRADRSRKAVAADSDASRLALIFSLAAAFPRFSRVTHNAEVEAHIFGIIADDIPYVAAEEDEEEDVSSYLNLDGDGEGRQQGDDEGTGTVDGGEPSTNSSGDVEKQLATTCGEPSAGSSKKSVKTKRGKTKTLKQGVTYNIDVICSATGRPLEPEAHYTKFINQCGVVVRDSVPITVRNGISEGTCGSAGTKRNPRRVPGHFILPPESENSMKRPSGSALPCLPGALHHNNPIQDGYARVTVEDIVQGFEDLKIDYATPEGERRLGDVKRQLILWKKKFIKFRRGAKANKSTLRGGGGHLHLLHVSRRRPRIHGLCLRHPAGATPPAASAGGSRPNPPPANGQLDY